MRRFAIAAVVGVWALVLPGVAHAALISSWPLANDARDVIGSNNGTVQNVTFTGSYAVFDPGDDRITVPYSSTLSPGSADVTVSVDVNTTHMPGTNTLDFDVVRSAPTGPYYKIELFPHNGKGQAQCFFKGSSNHKQIHGGPSLIDGAWHTIVCQKTANAITLTVDGTQVASASITIGSIVHRTGSVFAIGYKPLSGGGSEDRYIGWLRNASVTFS